MPIVEQMVCMLFLLDVWNHKINLLYSYLKTLKIGSSTSDFDWKSEVGYGQSNFFSCSFFMLKNMLKNIKIYFVA